MNKPSTTALRAAIYVRLSKEDLRGQQLGIESCRVQEENAREAIAAQAWRLDEGHVYVDDGVSGGTEERKALQAMLAAAKRREFDVIVVRALDRLSRLEAHRSIAILSDLHAVGVKVWKYREGKEVGIRGPDLLLTTVDSFRGEGERLAASYRSKENLQKRANEGRATGKPPFGYRLKTVTIADARGTGDRPGKWAVKHEPELAVVRRLFDVFLQTESYRRTAIILNDEGLRSAEGPWVMSSVLFVLKNPYYRGYRMFSGQRYELPDLAILSPEQITRLEAAMAHARTNRPWHFTERKGTVFNVCSGVIACGLCGGCIAATGSGPTRSYHCNHTRTKACPGIGMRVAWRVEKAVIEMAAGMLTPERIKQTCDRLRKELRTTPKRADDRKRIEAEITSAKRRKANLIDAVATAPQAHRGDIYEALDKEKARLATLEKSLERLKAGPPELDARRLVANLEKQAEQLRQSLAKGGREAAEAVRVLLGGQRLRASLVTIQGKRAWKLHGTGTYAGLAGCDVDFNGLNSSRRAVERTIELSAVA